MTEQILNVNRMKASGLKNIVVTYSGSGDSGSMHNAFSEPAYKFSEDQQNELQATAERLVELYHSGWEIDDGASGEVIFEVVGDKVQYTINHGTHYISTEYEEDVGDLDEDDGHSTDEGYLEAR